jgi:hypothetical protein
LGRITKTLEIWLTITSSTPFVKVGIVPTWVSAGALEQPLL